MVDRFCRRSAHLLAFPAPGARLGLRFLAVMFLEADIHIPLNIGDMIQDILDDALFQGPAKEVQLTHSGLFDGCRTADLETDALATAKRVKETLGIGLEFALVVKMHHELRGLQGIAYVEFLGIVGDKPVNQTKADR